jgi:pimeloyl-ACP methyl ester carboxylesterase
MTPELVERTLASGLKANVLKAGQGAPLVFLHSHLGRTWDAFLDALAAQFTVYAPLHPGSENEAELLSLDAVSDLVLYYDDLFATFGIERPIVVGHSFGGMAAAEYAAYFNDKPKALVLMDALGLWIDDAPVADINAMAERKVPALLLNDTEGAAARELFALPTDPQKVAQTLVERFSTRAAVSHFIWPIPDRDLRRRLYRIATPTLVLWGRDDRYVPLAYASEFANGIRGSRTAVIDGAAHFPQLEQTATTVRVVTEFLSTLR